MAGERNSGWPGFFRVFAVFAALMLLLAQSGQELVPICRRRLAGAVHL